MNYYEMVDKYGTSGAERICTLADNFMNTVRMKHETAIRWGIAQYEASQELPDRLFDCLTRMSTAEAAESTKQTQEEA